MATIALYAGKINNMPSLIKDVKKSVTDFKSELSNLKNKSLQVNKSICNLDDVISAISTSTQTQEQKVASLESFQKNSEQFITDTARIDSDVADIVNQRKDDFYDKYHYLKPDCEKGFLEKAWDDFKSDCAKAWEWCKEHWKLIVTAVLVIAAIVVIVFFPAAAPLLLAIAKGIIIGAAVGGIIGGTMSTLTGGSFWEGFENGAFSGAIAGAISGGMGFVMSSGGTVALTLGQTMLIGGVSGIGVSLIGDLGDKFIKDVNISWGQMFVNMAISGTLGAAFAGIGYGISKGFAALKLKFSGKADIKLPENATNMQKGNYGEMKMDASFEAKGYERISLDRVTSLDAPTRQGLDGVYCSSGPPPSYAIGEAKFGTSTLSKLVDGTPQMSDNWIQPRLVDSVGKDLAREINKVGYDRVLVNVDSSGNVTHSLLDALGKIIK